MKKFEIYQLPIEHDAKFMNLEFVQKHDIMPVLSDYKKVWEGEVEDSCDLEDLYISFNLGVKPKGYKGHSMSISDVVKMEENFYYCDSFGWEQISL